MKQKRCGKIIEKIRARESAKTPSMEERVSRLECKAQSADSRWCWCGECFGGFNQALVTAMLAESNAMWFPQQRSFLR